MPRFKVVELGGVKIALLLLFVVGEEQGERVVP